jgi:hypothetical protein
MISTEYDGYAWIKVPPYKMDESLSWEQRYRQLEHHHIQETTFLIDKVRELAAMLEGREHGRALDAADALTPHSVHDHAGS